MIDKNCAICNIETYYKNKIVFRIISYKLKGFFNQLSCSIIKDGLILDHG